MIWLLRDRAYSRANAAQARCLPLPWPLFGAAFCLWALSGVPPTGVTGEHGHNGLLFSECLNQPSNGFLGSVREQELDLAILARGCSSTRRGTRRARC